ncbi:unnamed protein product [Brachionus calyciflorus]|uniref:Uncharacterized protein n=1 Tax=Brachionus calyciflorus TaxID=104777 RepID=A0A814RAP4_9BILA|nr:unnamed protein product [Brachionus calyciflorus]
MSFTENLTAEFQNKEYLSFNGNINTVSNEFDICDCPSEKCLHSNSVLDISFEEFKRNIGQMYSSTQNPDMEKLNNNDCRSKINYLTNETGDLIPDALDEQDFIVKQNQTYDKINLNNNFTKKNILKSFSFS